MNNIIIEEDTSYGHFKYVYKANDLKIVTQGLTLIINFYDVNLRRFITKVISLDNDKITIEPI